MPNRAENAKIAADTLAILAQGWYTAPGGQRVSIAEDQARAVHGSLLYQLGDLRSVHREARTRAAQAGPFDTAFEVINETTLGAARRLVVERNEPRVAALNFASAKNPGGGFMGGSSAQEESLARSSGLYPAIAQMQQYYHANRTFGSSLYTDHLIYSPDVPVFKDDAGNLLERPYPLSFITAPAVNAGVIERSEPTRRERIEPVMRARIGHVLAVAVANGHDVLVLGAWGCGVFKNAPGDVARWFADALLGDGAFRGAFRTITFAVLDRSAGLETLDPFRDAFAATQ